MISRLAFRNIVIIVLSFISIGSFAQSGIISTIAGNGTAGFSGDGGPAGAAIINHPGEIISDPAGNIYFAELDNHRVRKISTSGVITTVAGSGIPGFSGDGGPATSAKLNTPYGVALDAAGNLYISDAFNNRIRKVTPSGIITTVAGTGTGAYSGDGGPAAAAALWIPTFIHIDNAGNLFICDNQNQVVRKVNTSGIITTIAGNGSSGYSGDGGPATSAMLGYPCGVFADNSGNVYICDVSDRIRKVNSAGIISTFVGTGVGGYSGDGGPAISAMIDRAQNIYIDAAGNLFFADTHNNRIRKVNTAGIITTVAGSGTAGFSGDGGLATAAQLKSPDGVWVDPSGRILIADVDNQRIRVVGGTEHIPSFTAGATAILHVCEDGPLIPINTLLAVTDSDAGQTLTWSVVTAPAHGTLVAGYSTIATGGTVTPTGLSFTPAAGYLGADIFKVKVGDGIAFDTITINVTFDPLPDAGVISGIDSVCPGHSVTLSETVPGGIWSYSNGTITSITFAGVVTGILPGRDTIIYTVINGCGIVSAIFPFKVSSACATGIEQLARTDISIYPNPSNGPLHVFVPASQQTAQVFVTNILGQKVAESTINTNSNIALDLDVAPGIYMLHILVGSDRYDRKITITR